MSGMVWNEKYLKWGFWTPTKPVVDISKWSAPARHFAQFILK